MKIKIGDKEVCILHDWKIIKEKKGHITWPSGNSENTCGYVEECSSCKKQRAYCIDMVGTKNNVAPWVIDVEIK